MRSKTQSYMPHNINMKHILICLAFLFLLFLILRSNHQSPVALPIITSSTNDSSSPQEESVVQSQKTSTECPPIEIPTSTVSNSCDKIPASLAEAMVHYATSNVTPQQTKKEVSVSLKVLQRKSPCNFLVFGLGLDSLMWTALNHGGRTVFLEEDKSWIDQITRQLPSLEAYHVAYNTKVTEADELMEMGMREDCKAVGDPRESRCELALKGFPSEVYDMDWDVIMVDAPTGWHEGAPGRMTAIYTAGLMARNRESGETEVFVHDVDRTVEDKFSKAFLCEGYLIEQEGRIRHFSIPSHRARSGRPFCP